MQDLFDESRADFKGFNKSYRDNILPRLIAKDMERRHKLRRFKMLAALIIATGIAVSLYFLYQQRPKMLPFTIIGTIIGCVGSYFGILGKMKAVTKDIIVGGICQHLGWEFNVKDFTPIDLQPFLSFSLLRRHDRAKFEDQMLGQAHGCAFRLNEAHLERRQQSSNGKGSEWVTVFRGVLMELEFKRKFMGQTIILRDAGFFNRNKRSGLKRVGLVDPKFEKIFECYGSDQVEARYLLTPPFMQCLVDLEDLLSGKKLRAGFIGGKLIIAISAPNQFEAGSMFKSLTDQARVQKILDEIGTVFDIVDLVSQR